MKRQSVFEVDREGLAKILERRGKAFALMELWQNAVDERSVTRVDMTLAPVPGQPLARLRVEDDSPTGWRRLSDAFTLFAPSYKRDNPKQRGRFNLGEKLVIAACLKASIATMQGTVEFDQDGRHEYPRRKRERGTVFEGDLRMTRKEYDEACRSVRLLIVPPGVATTFNGIQLKERSVVAEFEAKLLTEEANKQGWLRRVERPTRVKIHDVLAGESGRIYELGIPVAETGDRWDVNVQQKVPLNIERDGVSASYLRKIRTHTLNATAQLLSELESQEKWIDEALEGPAIKADAVNEVLTRRHGEKRVIQDPSDIEAGRIATSKGYEVIGGRSYSSAAWQNIRRHAAALPAGQVTPSPKPFSDEGRPLVLLDPTEWTDGHRNLAEYACALHDRVIGTPLTVSLTHDEKWPFKATYGTASLIINVAHVSDYAPCIALDALLIHEFAHYYGGHLTAEFDDALARIGAAMVRVAREEPQLFDRFSGRPEQFAGDTLLGEPRASGEPRSRASMPRKWPPDCGVSG